MPIVLICAALFVVAFCMRPSPNPVSYWAPLLVAVFAFLALIAYFARWQLI